MRPVWMFAPLALLILFAGYLGLQWGRLPSETEIINRYISVYLTQAPKGAQVTDCAAAPHPAAQINLVVNCVHANGSRYRYHVNERGILLSPTAQPAA